MSEFKVEAVRIGTIEKHPNADSLSITQVLGGYRTEGPVRCPRCLEELK